MKGELIEHPMMWRKEEHEQAVGATVAAAPTKDLKAGNRNLRLDT
jgi:hypothetical protein